MFDRHLPIRWAAPLRQKVQKSLSILDWDDQKHWFELFLKELVAGRDVS